MAYDPNRPLMSQEELVPELEQKPSKQEAIKQPEIASISTVDEPSNYDRMVEAVNNDPYMGELEKLTAIEMIKKKASGKSSISTYMPPSKEQVDLLDRYTKLTGKESDDEVKNMRMFDSGTNLLGGLNDTLSRYNQLQAGRFLNTPINVENRGYEQKAKSQNLAPTIKQDQQDRAKELLAMYKELEDQRKTKMSAASADRDMTLEKLFQGAGIANRYGMNFQKPSDKLTEQVADLSTAKNETEKLINFLKEKNIGLGPIESRFRSIKGNLIGGEEDFKNLERDYQSVKNTMRKAIFGAALTGQEREDFDTELQTLNTNDENFAGNLQSLMGRIERKVQEKLSMSEAQGKNIKPFREVLNQETFPQDEKVEVISPEGKPGRIPKRQLDAALKQGYKVK